jgi:MraZ protein
LYGSFEHVLDPKGRVVLPSRLRSFFEAKKEAAVLSRYLDRCLAIWAPEQFDHQLARAEELEDMGPEERQMARALSGYSTALDIDPQWRMTVPAAYREYAGLEIEKPIMVVGALNRVELWRVDRWEERTAPSIESLADGTSRLFLRQPLAAGRGGVVPATATGGQLAEGQA